MLSDKVGFISRQSADLLEQRSRMETTHSHLVRELEEKREQIRNLYAKLQLEKQVGTSWFELQKKLKLEWLPSLSCTNILAAILLESILILLLTSKIWYNLYRKFLSNFNYISTA